MHMSLEPRAGGLRLYIHLCEGWAASIFIFFLLHGNPVFLKAETDMNLIQGWKSSAESQQTDR